MAAPGQLWSGSSLLLLFSPLLPASRKTRHAHVRRPGAGTGREAGTERHTEGTAFKISAERCDGKPDLGQLHHCFGFKNFSTLYIDCVSSEPMTYSQKVQTPPSGPLGWLNCIRQDQSSTGKYLDTKQLRNSPGSARNIGYKEQTDLRT